MDQKISPDKKYWRIERIDSKLPPYVCLLPGNYSSFEIGEILRRLASMRLEGDEIVSASRRKPNRTGLLDIQRSFPPNGQRLTLSVSAGVDYVAGYFRGDELINLNLSLRGHVYVDAIPKAAM